jgi:zinc protease
MTFKNNVKLQDKSYRTKNHGSLIFHLSALILLFQSTAIAVAAPVIQHWETKNGARVYFVPAPELPMVDVQVIFDAGGSRDGNNGGIAQLTNNLLDDGAGKLNADQIAERFEGVGAQFGASSFRDMAVTSLRSLTDPPLLQPALETYALLLRDPTFPTTSFERVRNQMLIALQAEQQSPGDIASKAFYKAMYADHPYASPVLGTNESLNVLGRGDAVAFHKRYYVARNAVIAIVGAVDLTAAEALANTLVSGLPAGEAPPPLPEVPPLTNAQTIHVDYPSTQTHVLIGHPGMTRDDPDYFALYVGNHILGGSGLVSRISEEVREKRGLSYSASSYFIPMRDKGPYTLGLQTRNDQADEAINVLRATLRQFIDEGPTGKELKASKQNITGGFPLRISSNSKIVENISAIGFYNLPLDYLDTFNDHIDAVTIEQIKEAFKHRVHPDKMVTVTVGAGTAP